MFLRPLHKENPLAPVPIWPPVLHLYVRKTTGSALLEPLPRCFKTETPWRKLCRRELAWQPSRSDFASWPLARSPARPRAPNRPGTPAGEKNSGPVSPSGSRIRSAQFPEGESVDPGRSSSSSETIRPLPPHRPATLNSTPNATAGATTLSADEPRNGEPLKTGSAPPPCPAGGTALQVAARRHAGGSRVRRRTRLHSQARGSKSGVCHFTGQRAPAGAIRPPPLARQSAIVLRGSAGLSWPKSPSASARGGITPS